LAAGLVEHVVQKSINNFKLKKKKKKKKKEEEEGGRERERERCTWQVEGLCHFHS
jgi:hypothetical protein